MHAWTARARAVCAHIMGMTMFMSGSIGSFDRNHVMRILAVYTAPGLPFLPSFHSSWYCARARTPRSARAFAARERGERAGGEATGERRRRARAAAAPPPLRAHLDGGRGVDDVERRHAVEARHEVAHAHEVAQVLVVAEQVGAELVRPHLLVAPVVGLHRGGERRELEQHLRGENEGERGIRAA